MTITVAHRDDCSAAIDDGHARCTCDFEQRLTKFREFDERASRLHDAENFRLRQELTTARALLAEIYHRCSMAYSAPSRIGVEMVSSILALADKGRLR